MQEEKSLYQKLSDAIPLEIRQMVQETLAQPATPEYYKSLLEFVAADWERQVVEGAIAPGPLSEDEVLRAKVTGALLLELKAKIDGGPPAECDELA
jgi:hypothetical protein